MACHPPTQPWCHLMHGYWAWTPTTSMFGLGWAWRCVQCQHHSLAGDHPLPCQLICQPPRCEMCLQADGSIRVLPRLTAAGVRQGTKQAWFQQQAARRAQPITVRLQHLSSKVHDLAGALAFANELFRDGGVYEAARAEYSKAWWGRLRLQQHIQTQRFYEQWFQQLLRLAPRECPGPVVVMYGDARWGAQRGHAQAPVRAMVRRMAHEPGFVVLMVDEFRTSSTYWATGQETTVVANAAGERIRQMVRISAVHGPAHYIGRDVNAAINILIAGLLAFRVPHLQRIAGQQAVNRDVLTHMRHTGRLRDTRAQQAAVGGPARAAARDAAALP